MEMSVKPRLIDLVCIIRSGLAHDARDGMQLTTRAVRKMRNL